MEVAVGTKLEAKSILDTAEDVFPDVVTQLCGQIEKLRLVLFMRRAEFTYQLGWSSIADTRTCISR
jgi:hypothetical protein